MKMIDKKIYIGYYLKNKVRRKKNVLYNHLYRFTGQSNVFNRKEYLGKKFIDFNEANFKITDFIFSEKPFLVARYGGTEMNMLRAYFEKKILHHNKGYQDAVNLLCETAGFFPADGKLAEQFVKYILDLSKIIDLLGIWHLEMEDYICEQYAKNAEYTKLRNLEPYYAEDVKPWTYALESKKVLVIHPFAESIQVQYKNRNEIWKNKFILPEFELQTIKAVQTMADQKDNRFHNWFEALDYMVEECGKRDFDIALIGCGAYGMPLAAEIKKMGKGAIHLGGPLQILFGIKGNRWDMHPVISRFYNDAWIRPIEALPKGGERVEGGCYW